MSSTMEAVTVNAMLGDYANTVALKQGKVKSDRVRINFLKFAEGKVPHDHFKQVVKGDFDLAELAIMTFLQAIAWGRPLVALPIVLHGRFQHAQLAYNAERGAMRPADLAGKRIGMRTYSQTTPTWVRGILQNDFGIDLQKIQFVTFDDGHVPEFRDPPNAQRAPAGKKLLQMLLDGEIDAAVLSGADLKNPKVKSIVPDPAAAGRAWHRRFNAIQANHVVVVQSSLSKSAPWAVQEIFRMLKESNQAANLVPKDGIDLHPVGFSAVKRNFEVAAEFAWQQRIIPKPLTTGEMFDEVTRALE